ncbi:MAG: ABC transporter permease [Tissierella sp.]|uniref:ABC transporter permease n=1 Tax=Tissierella sp. TaxID=41274 RepID=UPI003F954F34
MIDENNSNKSPYIEEARFGLNRNKRSFFIIIIQCIICLVLISIGYSNFKQGHNSLRKINDYYNQIHYSLHDVADEDGSFSKYLKSEKEYYKLKSFVEELRNNDNIDFINTILQPIDIINKNIPKKFFYQYEEGYAEPIREENEIKYSFVKSTQISKNLKDVFSIEMDSGNYFSEEDYILNDNLYHNIILGYEYKDYFKIGDTIKAEYISEKFKLHVIGFFPKDTNIVRNNDVISLDRYICMPAFTELNYNKFEYLTSFALSQQANGQILTLDKKMNVAELVEQTSNKYGTFKFEVYSDNTNETKKLVKLSDDVLSKIRMITIILVVFTVISITMSMLSRIQKDYYRFGVQLLCGASIYNILLQISIELITVIAIAVFCSLIISSFIIGFGNYQLLLIFVGFTIFITSMIVPTYVLLKKETSQLIRGEE